MTTKKKITKDGKMQKTEAIRDQIELTGKELSEARGGFEGLVLNRDSSQKQRIGCASAGASGVP